MRIWAEFAATLAVMAAVAALNASLLRDDILFRTHARVISPGRFVRTALTFVPAAFFWVWGDAWPQALVTFLDVQRDFLADFVPVWIATPIVSAVYLPGTAFLAMALAGLASLDKRKTTWRAAFLESFILSAIWCVFVIGLHIGWWLVKDVFPNEGDLKSLGVGLILLTSTLLFIGFFGGIFFATRWATRHPSVRVNLGFFAVVAVCLVVGALALLEEIPEGWKIVGVAGIAAIIIWGFTFTGSPPGLRGMFRRRAALHARATKDSPYGLKQFDPPK